MSMSDPISDLLTRIRNALLTGRERVEVPASRLKEEICAVLQREGYIEGCEVVPDGKQGRLMIRLKYTSDGSPVLQGLRRVSKPSLRVYAKGGQVRPVRSGLGISILTTSHGVMTGKQARERNAGGEVLCEVW
ncbi:MAG: 30S ribosomal protein S8 [Candidatus Hydrogenedentes bacterium]|nr:30S ribosomal protein S8 [Candidatus Hydrogenedentota bacterium]